ncbi:MAG TPA: chorismate synthase [Eubacteriaceae bacterium]|nr:chorismate synthase [Eubacteriaceae bacterium]
MSSSWNSSVSFSLFGESHGAAIGGVIDGLPPGIAIDMEAVRRQMERRKPGKEAFSTKRQEEDEVEIISGYFNGFTTGTPLAFLIKNKDQKSKDYESIKERIRPGHADFSAAFRYKGFQDYRGGGHFSGRLTAPLVFYGAIAKSFLKERFGIEVIAKIEGIAAIEDDSVRLEDMEETLAQLSKESSRFPVVNENKKAKMIQAIEEAAKSKDSLGGVIRCFATKVMPGLGDPFFDSLESKLAHMIFSVPAVKGLSFGKGFDLSNMKGSEANDSYYYDENQKILSQTNNNGGILGGISTGMPIDFKVAFKPTPSIAKKQKTLNLQKKENTELEITGRHDPCIVPRALPVVESCMAIVLFEQLAWKGME